MELLFGLLSAMDLQHLPDSEAMRAVAEEARSLGSRPASEVKDAARRRFTCEEPETWQVLYCLAVRPSPACAALFGVVGLSGPEVAVEVRLAGEEQRQGAANGSGVVSLLLGLWTVLEIAVAVSIFLHARASGDWWELILLVWASASLPSAPAWFRAVSLLPLCIITGPVAGGLRVAQLLVGRVMTRCQRNLLWARTGVRLTHWQTRKFDLRHGTAGPTMRKSAEQLAEWRTYRLMRRLAHAGPVDEKNG
ncbi:hypothetical protein [Streptomyces sp. NPDC002845]